jgi:hypothetical protein
MYNRRDVMTQAVVYVISEYLYLSYIGTKLVTSVTLIVTELVFF